MGNVQTGECPSELYAACKEGDLSKVQEFFKTPEDLKASDQSNSLSPLAYAVKSGYLHIVQFLLDKAGDVNFVDSWQRTTLYYACCEGMTHIVKWLLENGAAVNVKDVRGHMPIHAASELLDEERRVEILKLLLEHGADPRIFHECNDSPLTLAFARGDVGLVKLYKAYFDIDLYTPQKSITPCMTKSNKAELVNLLYLAVKEGWQELITYLMENGVDFKDSEKLGFHTLSVACTRDYADYLKFVWNTIYNNNVPEDTKSKAIHTAAAQCYESIVELLLDLGCDCEAVNDYLETPLLPALIYSRTDSARILMERGADIQRPRFDGKTALHLYCQYNSQVDTVLKKVVAGSEDINITDSAQRTALHYAAMVGSTDVIRYLVQNEADRKAVDCKKATALHYFSGLADVEWDKGDFEFLGKDVSVEALDNQRKTPLHYAADSASLEYFQNLVDYGANVNAVSDDKGSVLHHTLAGHQWSKAEFLLEKGVYNDEPNNEGKTPLLCSVRRAPIIKMLLDKGAKIDAVDKDGQTALHLACEHFECQDLHYSNDCSRPEEVVELLVQRGCNVNTPDRRGRTPLHLAYACGNEKVIETLLSHGADKKAVDNDGKNILHYAVRSTETFVMIGLFDEISPNVPDKKGNRPLLYACDSYTLLFLTELTDNVKFEEFRDKKEQPPFIYECEPDALHCFNKIADNVEPDEFRDFFPVSKYIKVDYLKIVFERGASVNTTNERGDTMLHEFIRRSELEEVKFLLSKGADPNARNKDLTTPLHMAVDQMWLECVKLLVEHGADTSAKDKDRKSVFELALEHDPRYEKMVEYLVHV